MGNQSNIEALKAMGYKEPECNVADLYDTPNNHKTKAKILPIFSVMKSVCANKYDCYYQTIDFKCNAGDMKCKHKQTAS